MGLACRTDPLVFCSSSDIIPEIFLRLQMGEHVSKNDNIEAQPNNPLHGVTLEKMLNKLVDHYGWEELGMYIDINCFIFEPSIKSSLKFLRRNPWARTKVENLYITYIEEHAK
jgi:uncharacterized protein (DUF2132 family)